MKIIKREDKVKFKDLNIGDIFLFMDTLSFKTENAKTSYNERPINAVDLSRGQLRCHHEDDEVIPLPNAVLFEDYKEL